MDKNQLKHIIKEEYQNVKSFMEDKYGFTPELGKVISNPYAKSFVNEIQEPEVISQLRDIVNKKQNKKIKDPKSGKMMRVDLYSASAIVKVYDAVNKSNKEKFSKLSLPKMVNVAFTVMKKENVVKNHDGKAAPYGSGYEKVDEKFDKIVHLKLLNKALRAMPGSQKQKEIIRKLNVVRKAGGMRPLKETGLTEVGIFPITNYLSGIIPKGRLNVTNKQEKERVIALIKDLVFTLNSFWKSNKIPFRVREPRKSDMNRFKKINKRN